ncbi:hypothetical protein U1Q18_032701 [Sarracenia purpurea var. burkii]
MAVLEARIRMMKGFSPFKEETTGLGKVESRTDDICQPKVVSPSAEKENLGLIQNVVSEVIGNPIQKSGGMALCEKAHDKYKGVSASVRELSDQVEASIQTPVEGTLFGTVSTSSVATEALAPECNGEGREEDSHVDEENAEGEVADSPKAILLEEGRMNIDKVNLLDLNRSRAGYFPVDDALDCRPVSANRDLQIGARSCIVSGAHDLVVKMPKQELLSKVSASIPRAGKKGQIDVLVPKGMSRGSLGATEGLPSDAH